MSSPVVKVLSVRHHGPGSARAVVRALDDLQPDVVLIEGPADADPLAALAANPALVPPVALLAYAPDQPKLSAFWPLAVFSPEWQALSWAAERSVPVRFIDLPAAQTLAARQADIPPEKSEMDLLEEAFGAKASDAASSHEAASEPADPSLVPPPTDPTALTEITELTELTETSVEGVTGGGPRDSGEAGATGGPGEEAGEDDDWDDTEPEPSRPVDPIALLAAAGGYDDPERWWEDVVEARRDAAAPELSSSELSSSEPVPQHDPFEAITEAMAAVRAGYKADGNTLDDETARREAHMRQVLRATLKSGAQRVAVVCGAWHAPALTLPLPPAAGDTRTLRGLPKRKVALTWVPWTHSRLSYASGYGAGVTSPGWYAHLFATAEHPVASWFTRVAAVLRAADLPISTAHVIEATRLADTLATLRGRSLPGLSEVTDATRAVICEGNEATLQLVLRQLVVGEALGEVPDDTPTVPLESDLAATCRRLRFKREPRQVEKDLDLRKPTDLERSALLHRLRLLGIDWGQPSASMVRNTGTFRETWQLHWRPELAVDVIEASMWGTSVASAAAAKVCSEALDTDLPGLTGYVEAALLAQLDEALPDLLAALDARAAHDHDVAQLMRALPPLVRARRYGDVRGTDLSSLTRVIDALAARVCAGLPAAVTSLDDDSAELLRADLDNVHAAIDLHSSEDRDSPVRARWLATLQNLVPRADVHGLLIGRVVRLLLDAGVFDNEQAGTRLARALSVGTDPSDKAAWVEGFLAGSGLLLVHDHALLALLDNWLSDLHADDFADVAPLLRRTFSGFERGERRQIGEAVVHLGSGGARVDDHGPRGWSQERAAAALATVAGLLGLEPLPTAGPDSLPTPPETDR